LKVRFDEIDDQIGLRTLPAEERKPTAASTAAVRGIGECLLATAGALVEETRVKVEREGCMSVDVGGSV